MGIVDNNVDLLSLVEMRILKRNGRFEMKIISESYEHYLVLLDGDE